MAKMKKLAPGFYEGTHNGTRFTLTKVQPDTGKSQWYWKIGNSPAHDWYPNMGMAKEAAISFINETNQI